MKIKQWCFLMLFLSFFLFKPIKAEQQQTILILSDKLPYLMIGAFNKENAMDVYVLPSQLSLPKSQNSQVLLPLTSYDLQRDSTELQKILKDFYGLSITNTVYLHMDRIQEDTGVFYDVATFADMKHLTDYFDAVVKKIKPSMIFHASDYLVDDLHLSDYYHLYEMFHEGQPTIRYHYASYMMIDELYYPLDASFH